MPNLNIINVQISNASRRLININENHSSYKWAQITRNSNIRIFLKLIFLLQIPQISPTFFSKYLYFIPIKFILPQSSLTRVSAYYPSFLVILENILRH